jgi:hypothetical protein
MVNPKTSIQTELYLRQLLVWIDEELALYSIVQLEKFKSGNKHTPNTHLQKQGRNSTPSFKFENIPNTFVVESSKHDDS